jgi:TonB family protein
MNALFIYMIKAAVYLIAFYLVYSLMLSRDTSYGRNRAFILLSLALSLILPFITLETLKPMGIQFFGKFLSAVLVTASSDPNGKAISDNSSAGVLPLVFSIYKIGLIAFILKLLADFLNLLFMIILKKDPESRIIRFNGLNTAAFSAMGYIFISSRLSHKESDEIIRHEENHLRQNHFLDILFIEIVMAFQWFNPFIYLFNRSLRAIHEYQADRDCLNSGMPVVNYQNLLLSQVFKSRVFNLTNSFSNPSLIKKRMIMMTKKRTSSLAIMKLFIVIPVTGIVFLGISAYREIPVSPIKQLIPETTPQITLSIVASNSSSATNETIAPPPPPPPPPNSENTAGPKREGKINIVAEKPGTGIEEVMNSEPFVVVEEMPMFPGGDSELMKFLGEHTQYPEVALQNGIQGRVIIRFCVTPEGGVSRISVIKSVNPELDAEAIRVVENLPAFKPGKQGGKPVPVWYMVPIIFKLQ